MWPQGLTAHPGDPPSHSPVFQDTFTCHEHIPPTPLWASEALVMKERPIRLTVVVGGHLQLIAQVHAIFKKSRLTEVHTTYLTCLSAKIKM